MVPGFGRFSPRAAARTRPKRDKFLGLQPRHYTIKMTKDPEAGMKISVIV